MTTPDQVKQFLELALEKVLDIEFENDSMLPELLEIVSKIQKNLLLPPIEIKSKRKKISSAEQNKVKKGWR